MNLVALQFKTTANFQNNLDKLVSLITDTLDDSFILAPELCLNGYAYDNLEDACSISQKSIKILKKLSTNKTIALTLTTKLNNNYFNTLYIFHKGQIIHTQSKVKLFVLNDEKKYFKPGSLEDIRIIDIDGLKVASLICFELRFIDLWKQIQGADLILIPAMWGKLRKDNFQILTQSLAVINQCFVLSSDSANDDMAKNSGIITPFGIEYRDNRKEILSQNINLSEIKKMRRYMNVGI